MTTPVSYWVAGTARRGAESMPVTHPYDGSPVARAAVASEADVAEAVAAAHTVAEPLARTSAAQRSAALSHVARRLVERGEEVARLITAENGKPLRWARAEAGRAASVFRWAAEEARRFGGEWQRLDTDTQSPGGAAFVGRFPRGPVLGITPFNFPLNLVAHKVAPALAAGAPIIVKPAPATPLSALLLGELLAETELPPGAWSVVPVPNDRMPALVADPLLPVVSFTGSGPVGRSIQEAVPHKHVTLELGGNAAAVVCADWSTPEDLARAAERIAVFANYQAGQSCIAVQRVFADRSVADELTERVVERVAALATGDPREEKTEVGPLIDEDAARRVETWVEEAVGAGARVLTGGYRDGAEYAPTVLTGVPPAARIACEEVFGPVIAIGEVEGDAEAFDRVNDSRFGLQTGVFTHRSDTAFAAFTRLHVGGVVIGDVPSLRAEHVPYGGVKESGVGREGVSAAMADFTEPRVLAFPGMPL
ncbi:aldehyde dehydrogenase family protein [Streptomonospora litoralis]|uniref:Sulfoacetaldehyde dehydrogenase n=1 Tax=Streptomonospora litoralis TaxID=2498135 RepID=A0A4P6PZS2_9ACTN|nr:aldehyde dehydrogenase family protein [Streptomonospora litoralis]QBI53653.1 Sulfoacetaldehyde dehydrogenase [Streptomonospora litoralis]